jgi:hypothetical protein
MGRDSLNSLPETDTFNQFMEASLVIMRQECPPAYQRMCDLLTPRKVMVMVDAEVITLTFEPRQISWKQAPEPEPAVILRSTRHIIIDLTDGKYTLQQAVMEGRVTVQGSLRDLILFHEGWLTYMRGAVHCPSVPDLLERFRYTS